MFYMEARYFRYQYENTEDGIIQSGCIWDAEMSVKTAYLYMSGEYAPIPKLKRRKEGGLKIIPQERPVDILVLGAYTITYIRRLIEILQERRVRTVILPYVPPMIRLKLSTYLIKEGACSEAVQKFMSAPYAYLKGKNVENVYLIYGNGPALEGEARGWQEGHYFERVDEKLQSMITEMEGAEIPVYRAGFIIENHWFYYYGFYSVDIPWDGTKIPLDTITMFAGPANSRNEDVDGLFSAKVYTREQQCSVHIENQYEKCALKCLYRNDYVVMKKHMDQNHENLRAGVLNLGNVNLKANVKSVIARYGAFLHQVRVIAVPNCGNGEYWDSKLLSVFTGLDLEYYICACGKNTDSNVIRDIVTSSSFNRFINVNEEFAYCFSGYIVQKEEK